MLDENLWNHRSASGYNVADLREAICEHVLSHGYMGQPHRLQDMKFRGNPIYQVFGKNMVEAVANDMCETVNGEIANPGRWHTHNRHRMVFRREGNALSFQFGG